MCPKEISNDTSATCSLPFYQSLSLWFMTFFSIKKSHLAALWEKGTGPRSLQVRNLEATARALPQDRPKKRRRIGVYLSS